MENMPRARPHTHMPTTQRLLVTEPTEHPASGDSFGARQPPRAAPTPAVQHLPMATA